MNRTPALALLVSIFASASALAQGTAFTYQGRLNEGAVAANGRYDLRFELYSDLGSPVPGTRPITNQSVLVASGTFTVSLDFGNKFDGSVRLLDLGVRTNGNGPFTTLVPRQVITPTPYAVTASNLTGRISATQLDGTIGATNLSGNYNGSVAFTNVGNQFAGNGAGLTNVNATLLDGIDSTGFWKLTGNVNTNGRFIGTLNTQRLELRVNNKIGFRIEPTFDNFDDYAVNIIGGSASNRVGDAAVGATIAGGGREFDPNVILGEYSTISGGLHNTVSNDFATIGGGIDNMASHSGSTVAGGSGNSALGINNTVGGGAGNRAEGNGCVVGGGGPIYGIPTVMGNIAAGLSSTVSGGTSNRAIGFYSTVGGGAANRATNDVATIAGGEANLASGANSSIGGGYFNSATAPFATVAGGSYNVSSAEGAFVGGGSAFDDFHQPTYPNLATGNWSVVVGGQGNTAGGEGSSVGGGTRNLALDFYSSVIGGGFNQATGRNSTVLGGFANVAGGNSSSAGGNRAQAMHDGSFVWSDVTGTTFTSTSNNQFLVRASGGVGIGTNSPRAKLHVHGNALVRGEAQFADGSGAAGNGGTVRIGNNATGSDPKMIWFGDDDYTGIGETGGDDQLHVIGTRVLIRNRGSNAPNVGIGNLNPTNFLMVVNARCDGNSWINSSDRDLKKDFKAVNAEELLDKVLALPLQTWVYKSDTGSRHLGPVAQDFKAAFGLGSDDKSIASVDADGVALAAIQGLNRKLESETTTLRAELKRRDAENADLKSRLERLEKLIAASR